MSGPTSFRISAETYDLLKQNRDFYESLFGLNKKDESPLLPKATDPESRTESQVRENGDIEVSVILPVDNNADPADGRIYVRDTFVFDPSESVLKSYQRSFEHNGKGGDEWKGWLGKYQVLPDGSGRGPNDATVQKFAHRVARSYGRPIVDDDVNTLSEIKASFTKEGRLLSTTNQQILDLNAGLGFKIKDKLNFYNLAWHDGKLEVTIHLSVDDDAEVGNGRIQLRDKFTLDANTLAFEGVERIWSLAPGAEADDRYSAALKTLQGKPAPNAEEAAAFINNLLPALLPKGEPDGSAVLALLGAGKTIPKDYQSPFARRGKADPEALKAGSAFSLEAMFVLAQEQVMKRQDESQGWLNFSGKVDHISEKSQIEGLFQKLKAAHEKNPGTSPFALMQGMELSESETQLRDRLLGDKLMIELDTLAQEPDAKLRAHAFAILAQEKLLVNEGLTESAVFLAEQLKKDPETQRTGEDILAIVQGKGDFGQKVGYVLPLFSKEVSKPSMLLGMAAAPFMGTAFELGALRSVAWAYDAKKISDIGRSAKLGAAVFGMTGEAIGFTAIHRGFERLHHSGDKAWNGAWQEILSATMLFGGMRLTHGATGLATARMAEGAWGSKLGYRFGEAEFAGALGKTPTGRFLFDRSAAMAGKGIPTLTTGGQIISGTMNHLGGILTMQGSGALSRKLGLQPDNQQSFGANFFDATVMYAQAMVGSHAANMASGGSLHRTLGEFKLGVENLKKGFWPLPPSAKSARPPVVDPNAPAVQPPAGDPNAPAFPPAQGVQARRHPAVHHVPAAPEPPLPVDPNAPVQRPADAAPDVKRNVIKKEAKLGRGLTTNDFSTLESAFRSAQWPETAKAEALALVSEHFSEEVRADFEIFGRKFYNRKEMLDSLQRLLLQMTVARFPVDAQIKYILEAREMDESLGGFLFHSPDLIVSLKENGMDADQINGVLNAFREDRVREAHYYREAARLHHTMIGFGPPDYPGILSALGGIKDSGWSTQQKFDFLLKIRLARNALDRFNGVFPTVKSWQQSAGWTAEQVVQFLSTYSLGYHLYNLVDIRNLLANHGMAPALQAELMTHLLQSKGHMGNGPNTQYLAPFLEFLRSRAWSPEHSFEVLNHLAMESREGSFNLLQGLSHLIESLEVKNWRAPEIKELIFTFTENAGSTPQSLFSNLAHYIPSMESRGWNRPSLLSFLKQLAEKSPGKAEVALSVFGQISNYAAPGSQFEVAKQFLNLLENCNPYNRAQVLELFQNQSLLFHEMGPGNFPVHLEFYATIMARWPRIGYSVLANLMEATRAGVIPKDIAASRDSILRFIDRTNGFNAMHYKGYLRDGENFFSQMDGYAQKILTEDFGIQDAQEIIQKYRNGNGFDNVRWDQQRYRSFDYDSENKGEKFLLGLIQRISPTSGVSFANDAHMIRLLQQILQAGDLRAHIPPAWRGLVSKFEISQGAMDLKPGEVLDGQGKVKALLDEFRMQPGEKEPSHTDLAEAMVAYLASGRDPGERLRLRQILFKRAAVSAELRDKLQNITELDFTSLTVLQEIFSDADNLPKFLKEAFDDVPRGQGLVTQLGSVASLMGEADGLVRQIKKVAQNKKITAERRKEILTNLIKAYKPEGIKLKILSREDLPQEIKNEIEAVLGEKPDLTPREIIDELLMEPLRQIEAEKNKFRYQAQGVQNISLRAVKGPAFGLHGFLSGVCIAPDVKLWQDPNFKLLAIIDENASQVLGYIHIYEVQIDGKKYITLPGINPSAEFLGGYNRKQTEALFQKLMEGVKEFAEVGGYHGVYIPTSANIHSNRGYIQDAIRKAAYPTRNIPQVKWNNLPSPYPFNQVYKVWEKNGPAKP